jgi:hypothetical protein
MNWSNYANSFPLVHCPVKHHFTDGVYVRECFTKGTLATSKFIKQNINFYLEGECIVWIDGVENFKSPYIGLLRQEHSALFMLLKI